MYRAAWRLKRATMSISTMGATVRNLTHGVRRRCLRYQIFRVAHLGVFSYLTFSNKPILLFKEYGPSAESGCGIVANAPGRRSTDPGPIVNSPRKVSPFCQCQ